MTSVSSFLELWLSIYKEVIQLCDAIDSLPDHCECGDAEAHLKGSCPCCREQSSVHEPDGHSESCTVLLGTLRADVTFLCQDFTKLVTPIGGAAIGSHGLKLRRGVFLAAEDLHKIATAVDWLNKAVVGFRRSCDLLQLHAIKHSATELRRHFHELNMSLTPDTIDPPRGAENL